MMRVTVEEARCVGCGMCVDVCPQIFSLTAQHRAQGGYVLGRADRFGGGRLGLLQYSRNSLRRYLAVCGADATACAPASCPSASIFAQQKQGAQSVLHFALPVFYGISYERTLPDTGAQPISVFRSSSTVVMPPMPKFSTSTFATFGERNAGSVGPRWMFFTPRWSSASRTMTAFCSYQAIL